MFSINLQWKEFSINLSKVETWLRANAGEHYCGNSAGADLTLWFTDAPSDDEVAAIELYWEALAEESEEVTSYQTADELRSAVEAKKASGKAKLIALGLTEDEANALLG